MFTKIHGLASCLLTTAIALTSANLSLAQERGGGGAGERGGAAAKHEVSGSFKSVDTKAGTITISSTVAQGRGEERREPMMVEKTFALAKDVEVAAGAAGAIVGRVGERGGAGVNIANVLREVKLTDLGVGAKVLLSLSADQKTVQSIVAEGPTVHGVLKAIDATKNSVTVQFPGRSGGRGEAPAAGEEVTYGLAADAEIAVDDGRGSRFSLKEAKLTDLAQGAIVTVRLFVDMKKVQSILAEGPGYHGTIKSIDAAKRTFILVVRQGRGDDAPEEYAMSVSKDAVIVVDNGKGKRLSVKLAKLSDIPVGATATVKMSVDQVHVMSIRAEGQALTGHLKSVDADKGVIVISLPKGRNDTEEKSLNVAKDAQVIVDGRAAAFADLKPDDSTMVTVRFSLDQQTVQSISSHKSERGR